MKIGCAVLIAVLATGCAGRSPHPAPRPPAQLDYLVSAYRTKPPYDLLVELRGPNGELRHVLSRGTIGEGLARWSPSGSMLAWVDNSGLHVARGDGSDPRLLVRRGRCTNSCTGSLTFAWSPDGRKLVVGGAGNQDAQLLVVDVHTGKAKSLVTPRPSFLYDVRDWSPNGSWITYTRYSGDQATCCDAGLYLSRPDGSRARRLLTLADPIHDSAYAAFSPDSRSLAVATCCDAPPQLRIIDLGSGRMRRIRSARAVNGTPEWSPDSKQLAVPSYGVGLLDGHARTVRWLPISEPEGGFVIWTRGGALVIVRGAKGSEVLVTRDSRSRPQSVFHAPHDQAILSIDAR